KDSDIASLVAEHSLNARAGKTPSADAANAAYTAVGFANGAYQGGGVIWGIVIDEYDLPIARNKNITEPLNQNRNIRPLIISWDNEAKLRRWPQCKSRYRCSRKSCRAYDVHRRQPRAVAAQSLAARRSGMSSERFRTRKRIQPTIFAAVGLGRERAGHKQIWP